MIVHAKCIYNQSGQSSQHRITHYLSWTWCEAHSFSLSKYSILCNVTNTCSRFPGVHHCYVLLSLTACMPFSAANEESLSCHVVFKNLIINYNLPSFP